MRIGATTFDRMQGALIGADGAPLPLRLQAVEVLRAPAEKPGELVTKHELLDSVWSGTSVTEGSLCQAIAEIRRALRPEGRSPLETHSGRGYRLAATSPRERAPERSFSDTPVRYTRAEDGVSIAWTRTGAGVPILKAPNWISHVALEGRTRLHGPVYARFAECANMTRFDQRGNGMSDRMVPAFTLDAMVSDMVAVADAAGLERFFLYGLSQGAAYAVAFAARYPERVRGLICRGGFAVGGLASGDPDRAKEFETRLTVIRNGWVSDNPSYRRFLTATIIPDAPPEIAHELDQLQADAVDGAHVARFLEFSGGLDVRTIASNVRAPVLLMHAAEDRMVPVAAGRNVAALLADVDFRELPSRNHIPIHGTEDFEQSFGLIEAFLARHA